MNLKSISLFSGLLLMTLLGPPLIASESPAKGELLLTDFTSGSPELGWYVVNDNVMGGRSEGDFEQQPGELRFAGRTNTNGGGFSSIRTSPLRLDLSSHTGIRLRVKGDGRRYTWGLTTDARWRGRPVAYWADFETRNGSWITVDIPFSSFIPRFRGARLDGPPPNPGRITGMGLMIYDNQDGPFEMHLATVHAYSANAPFTLTQYQWKNRVLVLSAPTEDDKNLRQQQDEVASMAEEFADRDMVLVILLDNGTSIADDRELSAGEAAAVRAALKVRPGSFALRLIGKDGSIKSASETAVSMTEIYALIDTMPMRQQEKSRP
jgi:hypothetical protein